MRPDTSQTQPAARYPARMRCQVSSGAFEADATQRVPPSVAETDRRANWTWQQQEEEEDQENRREDLTHDVGVAAHMCRRIDNLRRLHRIEHVCVQRSRLLQ